METKSPQPDLKRKLDAIQTNQSEQQNVKRKLDEKPKESTQQTSPSKPKQETPTKLAEQNKDKKDIQIEKKESQPSPKPKQETPTKELKNSKEIAKVADKPGEFKGTLKETPQRNNFQVRFWEALKQSNKDHEETVALAIEIENELFKSFGKKPKEHPQKFRTLYSNLKDPLNVALRDKLFNGEIYPNELIHLSHEDLANPQLQTARKKIVDDATEAMQGVKPSVSAMFTCGRCKKNETTYYQMQTRSADEPMTTFITCVNCNHHWKMY
jgi:transcription elongation factor S-II